MIKVEKESKELLVLQRSYKITATPNKQQKLQGTCGNCSGFRRKSTFPSPYNPTQGYTIHIRTSSHR